MLAASFPAGQKGATARAGVGGRRHPLGGGGGGAQLQGKPVTDQGALPRTAVKLGSGSVLSGASPSSTRTVASSGSRCSSAEAPVMLTRVYTERMRHGSAAIGHRSNLHC